MDAFIESFAVLTEEIKPILLAAVLVCLMILLIRLIKLTNSLTGVVSKTNGTIDLVDKTIEKVQKPLDTVGKVSETVDKVNDATVAAVSSAKDFIVKSAGDIKDKVVEYVNKDKEIDEEKEPSPEDIIGD